MGFFDSKQNYFLFQPEASLYHQYRINIFQADECFKMLKPGCYLPGNLVFFYDVAACIRKNSDCLR
jgi:hypothetical protein